MIHKILIICGACCAAQSGFARDRGGSPSSLMLSITGDIYYASSQANEVAGATYTRKYLNPAVVAAGLGTVVGHVYLGVRYEYWLAGRTMSLAGAETVDTLKHQSVGGELGYFDSNPRVYYLVSASVHYPLELKVTNSARSYETTLKPLTYEGRVAVGIRFSTFHSLILEGGYRYQNFGDLVSGATSYLPQGQSFDLSGGFIGVGLAFHF